jgi:hypothetical protein
MYVHMYYIFDFVHLNNKLKNLRKKKKTIRMCRGINYTE